MSVAEATIGCPHRLLARRTGACAKGKRYCLLFGDLDILSVALFVGRVEVFDPACIDRPRGILLAFAVSSLAQPLLCSSWVLSTYVSATLSGV